MKKTAKRTRRLSLTLVACLAWGGGLSSIDAQTETKPAAKPATKPNIIFILTDDQGFGDLSLHGNSKLKTPHIDRLGREGVAFTDFQVSPTCSPTRSALLSGRHPMKNGVTHTIFERERMALDSITVAQVLKRAGYTTGIFGKWHLGDEDAYQPGQRGFDEVFIHGGGGIGQTYRGTCGDAPRNTYFNPYIRHNGVFEKTEGYCTDVFFKHAQQWMAKVKGKQPFFCYIPTNAPHAPLQVRPEDRARYAGRVPDKVARYYGMVANIDDNVGRLLAQLDEWGIAKDTLVIFMSDNGPARPTSLFNAGLRNGKGSAYLGGVRVPSFWRWPGTLKPGQCKRFAAHIDFLPTLAEITQAPMDETLRKQVEGRSLLPLLHKPDCPWPDRMLVTHVGRWGNMKPGAGPRKFGEGNGKVSVRNNRYTLVMNHLARQQWALYDIQSDPGQKKNVIREHPEVAATMTRFYDQWWQQIQPFLVNEQAYKTAPKVNVYKEAFARQQKKEAR